MILSSLRAFCEQRHINLSNEITNQMGTNKDHEHKVNCKIINGPKIDYINNNNDNMENKYNSKSKILNFLLHYPQVLK